MVYKTKIQRKLFEIIQNNRNQNRVNYRSNRTEEVFKLMQFNKTFNK